MVKYICPISDLGIYIKYKHNSPFYYFFFLYFFYKASCRKGPVYYFNFKI